VEQKIPFEGGPLDGRCFELPPGTIELLVGGADLMPGNNRYHLVVRDSGVYAMWVGCVPAESEPKGDR
jgi:hypothetical protein